MNGVIEATMKTRELVAKAITAAESKNCPDGYADDNGFADNDWLSDWAAFVADHVVRALESADISLKPLRTCGTCGKRFPSNKRLKRHQQETGHIA